MRTTTSPTRPGPSAAAVAAALALLGASLLPPAQVGAQEGSSITFRQAIEIALDRNTVLKQAENVLRADEVSVDQARNDFLPDLRLTLSGGQTFGRTFDQNEGKIVDQIARSANTGISTTVTLFDGLGNLASLRQASRTRDAGRLELDRARQTVVFTVSSNFLALIEQQEQLRVRRENLSSAQALERQISAYVEAGTRTIADLYQQQAAVATARYDVVSAERAVALAQADLIQVLQLDPGGTYTFQAPAVSSTLVPSPGTEPLDVLLERAFALRSDLASQEALRGAAEQAVKVSGASRWPTLSLSAGYSTGYSSLGALEFVDQLDERRGGSVTLGVSIPLFDRGSTSAATQRARIAVDNTDLALQDARQTVGSQVARAYQDHRSAQSQLEAASAGDAAASLALDAAQERYDVGAATLVEITQARAARVQAAAQLVSARYGVLFQRLLLRYYVGDLDADNVALER